MIFPWNWEEKVVTQVRIEEELLEEFLSGEEQQNARMEKVSESN